MNFNNYKDKLFQILLSGNHHKEFVSLLNQLRKQGHSKKDLHHLFLEFHKEIQIDDRTKNDETSYNDLTDFMDCFIDDGFGFKFLPEESIKKLV